MGYVIGQLIGLSFWCLLWARIIQSIIKLVIKTHVIFKDAYLTTIMIGIATYIIGNIFNVIVPNIPNRQGPVFLLTIIFGFMTGTFICAKRIKQIDGQNIGIRKGALVSLLFFVSQIIFLTIIAGFVYFISNL